MQLTKLTNYVVTSGCVSSSMTYSHGRALVYKLVLPLAMWISLCERSELEDRDCGQRGYNYLLHSEYILVLKDRVIEF